MNFKMPSISPRKLTVLLDRLKKLVEAVRPILATLVIVLDKASPYIVMACVGLFKFYECLSSNISTALYGLIISVFGGAFPVAISVMLFTCLVHVMVYERNKKSSTGMMMMDDG